MTWTLANWSDNANWNTASRAFPLYDGHGNNVMTLTRSGSSFATSGLLKYDVWGGIRSGTPQGPNRYCANLGHKQDDESGLIYMRARYYEPSSGRFISEDPGMDGQNWYSYGTSNPVAFADGSGQNAQVAFSAFLTGVVSLLVTLARNRGEISPSEAIGAFCTGVAGSLSARLGGAITEAMEVGGAASVGAYLTGMSIGGFSRAVATMFIDMITGTEFDGGDFALACFAGGISSGAAAGLGGAPGEDWAKSQALSLFVGSVGALLHRAGKGK